MTNENHITILDLINREIYSTLIRLKCEMYSPSADAERLDFIIKNNHMVINGSVKRGYIVFDTSYGLDVAGRGDTARAAIDAARGDQKTGG